MQRAVFNTCKPSCSLPCPQAGLHGGLGVANGGSWGLGAAAGCPRGVSGSRPPGVSGGLAAPGVPAQGVSWGKGIGFCARGGARLHRAAGCGDASCAMALSGAARAQPWRPLLRRALPSMPHTMTGQAVPVPHSRPLGRARRARTPPRRGGRAREGRREGCWRPDVR